MSDPSLPWTARCSEGKFFACARLFVVLVAGFCALLLPGVYGLQGLESFLEAGAAALLCFGTGVVALAATSWQAHQPLVGLLLAMALRMILPLTVCLLLAVQGSGKQYRGFVTYLLLFYCVTLAIETFLSVRLLRPNQAD